MKYMKPLEKRTIRCNNCYNYYFEEELEVFAEVHYENDETEYFKGCPNCLTDNFLMDVDEEIFSVL